MRVHGRRLGAGAEAAAVGQQGGCSAGPGAGVRAVSRGSPPRGAPWASGDTGLLRGLPPPGLPRGSAVALRPPLRSGSCAVTSLRFLTDLVVDKRLAAS